MHSTQAGSADEGFYSFRSSILAAGGVYAAIAFRSLDQALETALRQESEARCAAGEVSDLATVRPVSF